VQGLQRISRRRFVGTGLAAAGTLAFGPAFWRSALAAPATPGAGPYGPLLAPDSNGIRLPEGFVSREVARANQVVPGSAYPWHVYSDGQGCFALSDGGWVLVSNSESLAATGAGSSAIRFGPDGSVADAYRILAGTNANCAGGSTPWGTWLSCEEHEGGQVWEADPLGAAPALNRPALGVFNHEAVAVDPREQRLYMTEDEPDGCFYRFTPDDYPALSSGLLEVAAGSTNAVGWEPVPDPSRISGPTREQVPGALRFKGGEGIWYDAGLVYFSTKGDNKVHVHDPAAATLDLVYDRAVTPGAPLKGVDNITVSPYGDLYVCEDGGDMEICLISTEREVAPFLRLPGADHSGSEVAGAVFDPSGGRMYFASQRGYGYGVVYEVSGPFRLPAGPRAAADPPPPALDAGGGEQGGPGVGAGPGGGVGTREDTDGPGLRTSAARRAGRARLLRHGIVVNVSVSRPSSVDLALRTSDLETEPGERGSTRRPVLVTLATARGDFERPGRYKVRLRLGPRAKARLRGRRSLRARISVQAVDDRGHTAVSNRRVRIVAGRGR
jgi:uncharacterized protein